MTDADRVTGTATPAGTSPTRTSPARTSPARTSSARTSPARSSPLGAAERRGLSLAGRLVLVVLGELGVAADIWVGTRDTAHVFLWLFVLLPFMLVMGILVTVQAHHRLPVAWHVVVFLGWAASLMIAPWASTWGHHPDLTAFQGAYVSGLGWFSIVAIQVSCLFALVRPAGSSYITVRKVAQAGEHPVAPADGS